MNISLTDIEKIILQSENDYKNVTINERIFKKDTEKYGDILGEEISTFALHYEKDGQQYQKSFFLKVPYNSPNYEELKQQKMYSKETFLYTVLLPQFQQLSPGVSFCPEFYGTDGQDVLILEDLSHSAFQKVENQQLNLKQSTVALKQLAKFHALSIKVHQTRPQILDDLQNLEAPPACNQLKSKFRKIIDLTDKTFAEKHPEVLLYFDNYLQQMPKTLLKSDDKFNVLNHGYFCSKNIWFAHDGHEDAKFTNFQYCHWGSPIIDLIFFAITSLPFEVFDKSFDVLLETFCLTLNAALEKLKCGQRLSVEDLKGSIDAHYEYFLYFLITMSPVCKKVSYSEPEKVTSKDCTDEESYRKLSIQWMFHFFEKGIFSKHQEIAIAIHTFASTFEATNKAAILSYDLDRNVLKPGDNFCSLIIRLKFEYQQETLQIGSVLLKVPSLSLNYDSLKETNVYNQEIFIYQNVFPEMYQLWKGEPFAPICYSASEAKILVLEDLSVQGFQVADKLKQLDLEHCRVALATVARYHAASLKYLQQCDETILTKLREPFNVTSTVRTLSQTLFSKFLRVMQPLVEVSVHQKMQAMADKIPQDAIYGRYMDDSGLNVLGHCDYWTNNILFQYKDGHLHSAKLIDWQLCRLASPVIDLIFFFITSARFEVFQTYKDALLNLYVDTLNTTLARLEFNLVVRRSEIDEAFRRYRYYFWLYVGTELPFVLANDGSFDSEANSDTSSELYLKQAVKWVNYLDKENLAF